MTKSSDTAVTRHLNKTLTSDALVIITTPERGHRATLRALAWRTLKAERGQTCDIARLEAMTRPLTIPTIPHPTEHPRAAS